MTLLDRQSRRDLAGRRVIMGFAGESVDAELKEVLREVQPAGVILFARNATCAAAARELNAELKSLVSGRPFVATVDQEGGRVARIRDQVTAWPPMRRLGELGDAGVAEQFGRALGAEARAMGFDVNFAPVLDVDSNPRNPVIGDRAFAADAERVGAMGTAVALGLQAAGVGACGKHFPGHGDTDVDSHVALPVVEHPLERLEAVEWRPFRDAITAGIGSLMTAHVVARALDPDLPATLSAAALSEPLRGRLGFEGVIVSDDIEMKAVADRWPPAEIARLGDEAGVDIFLACHRYDVTLALYRALVQRLEDISGEAEQQKLAQGRHIHAWLAQYARPVPPATMLAEVAGCSAHRLLAQRLESGPLLA